MFRSDKELSKQDQGRHKVLDEAKKRRQQREEGRTQVKAATRIQKVVRGRQSRRHLQQQLRLEFDKIHQDIQQLFDLLQSTQTDGFQLPWLTLYVLMQKLVFVYDCRHDLVRLEQLCSLMRQNLNTESNHEKNDMSFKDWIVQNYSSRIFRCFLDCCTKALMSRQTLRDGIFGSVSALMLMLLGYSDTTKFMDSFDRSDTPNLPGVVTYVTERLATTSAIFTLIYGYLIQDYTTHRNLKQRTQDAEDFDGAFSILFIILTRGSSSSQLFAQAFVQIFSIPLLEERVSPTVANYLVEIPIWRSLLGCYLKFHPPCPKDVVDDAESSVWLLGNVLSLKRRITKKNESLLVLETQVLTKLLSIVPSNAFNATNSPSWQSVQGRYFTAVVQPKKLTAQLNLFLREDEIRTNCSTLVQFCKSNLKKKLEWDVQPQPMNPSAGCDAEKYGFGNIAQVKGSGSSLWSQIWKQSKWAKKLFGFMQDQKPAEGLMDTSKMSKALAEGSTEKEVQKIVSTSPPFYYEGVRTLCNCYAVFFSRWPITRGAVSLSVLSTLAFSPLHQMDNKSEVSMVEILWSFLHNSCDLVSFTEELKLVDAQVDGLVSALYLFCLTFDHLLYILTDEEVYEKKYPLPLFELERIALLFKGMLYRAWNQYVAAGAPNDNFGVAVMVSATRLMRNLYNRCSTRPFCNASSWILSDIRSRNFIKAVLNDDSSSVLILRQMPYILAYVDRVQLFQGFVARCKQKHQPSDGRTIGGIVHKVRIRRTHLLEDGISQLNTMGTNLRRRVYVYLVNAAGQEEIGIDAGGLFKEFWTDLSALAFDPSFGLFKTTSDGLLYPSPSSHIAHGAREHLDLFSFLGRIVAKALFEGIIVQPKFATFFLTKILGGFNQLRDLPSLDPELYKNLMFLKHYEGDVADLALDFTISEQAFGVQTQTELITGGSRMAVTNSNRLRYIHLCADYRLNVEIREQSEAFVRGLKEVVEVEWLRMFNEPELLVLISGTHRTLDITDLKNHTKYAGGYAIYDKHVVNFWKVLAEDFTPDQQAQFLRFTTSCQRAPPLGFQALHPPFCITKVSIRSDDEKLPSASTCFNNLKLPTYSSRKVMKAKLLYAIQSGAGFEMS